jgi:hypothetical protein
LFLAGATFSIMAEVTVKNVQVSFREKVQSAWYGLLGVLVLGAIGWFIWCIAPDKYAYAFSNQVSPSNVYVEDRPTNCDFLHAPLGDKDCHYHKVVIPQTNRNGDVTNVYVTWERVAH